MVTLVLTREQVFLLRKAAGHLWVDTHDEDEQKLDELMVILEKKLEESA